MNTEPVKLAMKDRDAAVAVLARAFADYELLRYYFPDRDRRTRFARSFCFVALSVCLKYGETFASSQDMEGICGWMPPGTAPFGSREVLGSVPLRLLFRYLLQGASRMQSYDRYLTEIHRELVPGPHWYLHILGVDPAYQGQGFSSRLIRPILERIDRDGLACFVETHSQKNVEVYRRFGFETVKEGHIPETQLMSYAMVRKGIGQ